MGKTLVINDADFSDVKIGAVPLFVNDKYILKETNYQNKVQGYIRENLTWSSYENNYYLFWGIKENEVFQFKANPLTNGKAALVTKIPESEEGISFMNGHSIPYISEPSKPSIAVKASENGYVGVYTVRDGVQIFPSESVIIKNINDRTFNYEDNCGGINLYIRSKDGTWGDSYAPEGYYPTVFFNVFKDESLTIEADKATNIGLIDYSSTIQFDALITFMEGESARLMEEGTSVTIKVPSDGWLCVLAYDGEKNLFPRITLNK